MPDTRDININTSSTLATPSNTNTLNTAFLERAATLPTEELQKIDPTEITEGIRNLTVDPMTSRKPNPNKSFLYSGIYILYSDRIDAKIVHNPLSYLKQM